MKDRLTVFSSSFYKRDDSPTKDRNKYNTITKTFNELLMDAIIESGRYFYLPSRIGYLGVHKRSSKRKKPAPDFTGVWKGLPMRKHKNKHSESFYGKFDWIRGQFLSKYSNLYRFTPSRDNARKLAKGIKNKNLIHKYIHYVKH